VWKNRNIRYRTDRLVVKLSPAAAKLVADPVMLLQAILDAVPGATCLRGPGRSGRVVIGVPDGTDVLAVTSQLDYRDDVEYAEPDIIDAGVDENKPKREM
jgi:hypothetical protein